MAITKNAKKAHRQALRKRTMNAARKSAVRQSLKAVRSAKPGDAAALAVAYKAIDKAMKRGILKKNTAARRKAKVARMLAK
jgi:small subunit ribosomal protein S20